MNILIMKGKQTNKGTVIEVNKQEANKQKKLLKTNKKTNILAKLFFSINSLVD